MAFSQCNFCWVKWRGFYKNLLKFCRQIFTWNLNFSHLIWASNYFLTMGLKASRCLKGQNLHLKFEYNIEKFIFSYGFLPEYFYYTFVTSSGYNFTHFEVPELCPNDFYSEMKFKFVRVTRAFLSLRSSLWWLLLLNN